MKTKLIYGSFIAFASIVNAQSHWGGSGTSAGDIYRTGNTRIGGTTVSNQPLHIGDGTATKHVPIKGLLMKFASGDRSLVELHDQTGTNKLIIQTLAWGTYVGHHTGSAPLHLNPTGGYVGVNTSNPTNQFYVTAPSADKGITVEQTGTSAGAVTFRNFTNNGRTYIMGSTGSANNEGAGNFNIYETVSASSRLFVRGAGGWIGIGTIAPDSKFCVNKSVAATDHIAQNRGTYSLIQNLVSNAEIEAVSANCIGGSNATSVMGRGFGTGYNYGGFFDCSSNQVASTCYGVYASASGLGQNTKQGLRSAAVGDGTNWAGWFDGKVNITGSLYAQLITASDQSLKKNVRSVTNAMSILLQLQPKSYDLYNDNCPQLNFDSMKHQSGFIAQEMETILPNIVYPVTIPEKKDERGVIVNTAKNIKGVSYDQVIPLLVKGVQEQQEQLQTLSNENTELLTQANALQKELNEALSTSGRK